MKFLFLANFFVWLGIGGYVIFLSLKVSSLYKRIEEIKEYLNQKQ